MIFVQYKTGICTAYTTVCDLYDKKSSGCQVFVFERFLPDRWSLSTFYCFYKEVSDSIFVKILSNTFFILGFYW